MISASAAVTSPISRAAPRVDPARPLFSISSRKRAVLTARCAGPACSRTTRVPAGSPPSAGTRLVADPDSAATGAAGSAAGTKMDDLLPVHHRHQTGGSPPPPEKGKGASRHLLPPRSALSFCPGFFLSRAIPPAASAAPRSRRGMDTAPAPSPPLAAGLRRTQKKPAAGPRRARRRAGFHPVRDSAAGAGRRSLKRTPDIPAQTSHAHRADEKSAVRPLFRAVRPNTKDP